MSWKAVHRQDSVRNFKPNFLSWSENMTVHHVQDFSQMYQNSQQICNIILWMCLSLFKPDVDLVNVRCKEQNREFFKIQLTTTEKLLLSIVYWSPLKYIFTLTGSHLNIKQLVKKLHLTRRGSEKLTGDAFGTWNVPFFMWTLVLKTD